MSQLTIEDWHRRFTEQAAWTQAIRNDLYRRAGLKHARRILEVGCGTGVIASELSRLGRGRVYGLDLVYQRLGMACKYAPKAAYLQGDAHWLPYRTAAFDATLCHFLLLWLVDPRQALAEMARVTRPGGTVMALAEPDYGGRIDYPPELEPLGRLQADALRRHGADPLTGRKLAHLLTSTGLHDVETGVLGGQWRAADLDSDGQSEWEIFENDLKGTLPAQDLADLRAIDQAARQSGSRILYVPTFYAWGRVR